MIPRSTAVFFVLNFPYSKFKDFSQPYAEVQLLFKKTFKIQDLSKAVQLISNTFSSLACVKARILGRAFLSLWKETITFLSVPLMITTSHQLRSLKSLKHVEFSDNLFGVMIKCFISLFISVFRGWLSVHLWFRGHWHLPGQHVPPLLPQTNIMFPVSNPTRRHAMSATFHRHSLLSRL